MTGDQTVETKDYVHVSWAPGAAKLTEAERQKIVDDIVADSKLRHEQHRQAQHALRDLPFVPVPTDQLSDIYERMLRLVTLGQASFEEHMEATEEVRALRREVFAQSDFGACYAGQWLPPELRKEIRERVVAERRLVNHQSAAASSAETNGVGGPQNGHR